jgi:putative transcription factor
MPQAFNPGSGQDWAPVNAGGGSTGAKKTMTARELDAAKSAGLVTTDKRHGAGGNKSAHSQTALSTKKLEEATDVGTIAKVDKDLSKAIMQARTAKKLTQKDLATAINEKPQVVAEYESGKAIPNGQIIAKLEKKLGVKLPRPGKSKAPPKTTTGSGATGGGAAKSAAAKAGVTRGGPAKRR